MEQLGAARGSIARLTRKDRNALRAEFLAGHSVAAETKTQEIA